MELILQRPQKKDSVKQYSVLYVDDEPVNLRIFQHAFKRDYNVFTASNGYDALELLNENKIDLIITDQQMPKMSGVDLLAKIVPKHPGIIRMIMTGFSDIGAIIRAVNEFGLDKYLVKPWDRDQLKAEFDKALSKKKKEDSSSKSADVDDSVIKINGSIMPTETELKELLPESFLIYDNSAENQHGFWFGEKAGTIAVAFFSLEGNSSSAVAIKSYINLALSELFYKSSEASSSNLLSKLFAKIRVKFADASDLLKPMDISLALLDSNSKKITYSGTNQSIYFFDGESKLRMLNGEKDAYHVVDNPDPSISEVKAEGITEVYFISKSMVNQIIPSSNSSTEGVSFLQYMRGLTEDSMSDKVGKIVQQLSGDKAKCMIGLKF